jgi:GcrA cell cycle regulator
MGRWTARYHGILQLGARALRGAARLCDERHVFCGGCPRHQQEIRNRLYEKCRDRPGPPHGLAAPPRPARGPKLPLANDLRSPRTRKHRPGEPKSPASLQQRTKPVKLRSVGITPRLKALVDLAPDDCRYPYGGDREGEAITFCGHPRLPGSSYCGPHLQLTRGDGTASERAVAPVVLRLVAAA